MVVLKVSTILLGLISQCWTVRLNVILNGEIYTGNEFCIGDKIEIICSLSSNYHVWSWDIPDYVETTNTAAIYSYTEPIITGPENMFRIEVTKYLPTQIITSLYVTVYSLLDGTMIDCCRSTLVSLCQSYTLLILGPPSAPNISVNRNDDFKSFKVAIDPPIYAASCVIKYKLTVIENGLTQGTMTIDSNGTGSVGELNLCKNTYSFTALAMTVDSNGNSSDIVAGMVDFSDIYSLSEASLDNGIAQWDISNILPEECYAKYYLRLFQCKIENFAVLPELDLNDDDVKKLISDTSAAMSPTTSMVAGGSSDYEVDLDDCVTGTLYTSITRLDMQPISGHLVLYSAASTDVCSFTLKSDFVPSNSPQKISCTRRNITTVVAETTTTSTDDVGNGESSDVTREVVGVFAAVILTVIVLVVVFVLVYIWKKQRKEERSEYSWSGEYSSSSSSHGISRRRSSTSFNSNYNWSHSDSSSRSKSESAISYNTAESIDTKHH